jgi:hypothetical protein
LILLLSSVNPSEFRNRNAGLKTATSPPPYSPTMYPYLVSPTLFPAPDTIFPGCEDLGHFLCGPVQRALNPILDTATINQVPTYLVLATQPVPIYNQFQIQVGTGFQLELDSGTYSPSLARNILAGSATQNYPIQWPSAPVAIGSVQAGSFGGDAFAVSPNGSAMFAAVTVAGATYAFESLAPSFGSTWTSLTQSPISGSDPQFSFGGSAALLVTRIASSVTATTFYLHDTPTSATATFSVSAVGIAAAWLPNQGMGEEIVAVTQTSGAVTLYESEDGGHIFSSSTVAHYQAFSNTTAFNSIGSTHLWNPGGGPGEITAATSGSNLFIVFTSAVQGQTQPVVITTANAGVSWNGPYLAAVPGGSVLYPRVAASPAGYFYVVWRENSNGNWTVDLSEFAGDGRMIRAPGAVPGSDVGVPANAGVTPPALAIDLLQRPIVAWTNYSVTGGFLVLGGNATLNGATVKIAGAFLSPSTALSVLQTHFDLLQKWDYRAGNKGTLQSSIDQFVTQAQQNLSSYSASPSVSKYLCQAQNITGDKIYANVSHVQFTNASSSSTCGNLAYVIQVTNSSTAKGAPKTPANAFWSPSVANTIGPLAANVYLSVVTEWALEAMGVQPTWSSDPLRPFNPVVGALPPPASTIFSGQNKTNNQTISVSVNATPLNPTTGLVSVATPAYPSFTSGQWTGQTDSCGKLGNIQRSYYETSVPVAYFSNYTAEGSSIQSLKSSTGLSSIYLGNLTANATLSWSAAFTAVYAGTLHTEICLIDSKSPIALPSRGLPATVPINISGTVSTSLRMKPEPPLLVNPKNSAFVWANWTNTMPAYAWFNNSNRSYGGSGWHYSNNQSLSWKISEAFHSPVLVVNDWYTSSESGLSQQGGWNSSQTPVINAAETTAAAPLWTGWACTYQFIKNPVTNWGFNESNWTGGNLTVQWYSSVEANGWVTYYEYGVGVNLTQTAQVRASGNNWEYIVELHGLVPASLYSIVGTTASDQGCIVYEASNSTAFPTFNNFPLSEQDGAYDSISKQGGGATIDWVIPSNITTYARFVSGYLSNVNTNNASDAQLIPFTALPCGSIGCDVNLTALTPNATYSVQVALNLSVGTSDPLNFTSAPFTFTYLRDTSGDGLTDVEKTDGWTVPLPHAPGGVGVWGTGISIVTANPKLFATNGLTNDFIEKEYGLDPNTIDSAGSHMLDVWNLTFNLGSGNPALPTSGFQYWYENSTYNFAKACPSPSTGSCSFSPDYRNKTNLTDNSSGSSHALWSGIGTNSALAKLQALIAKDGVGWLRAVTGTWDGLRTLTVWGKLSWGANPLTQSTSYDGVPDGAQVNPLGQQYVQVKVNSWRDNATQGDGVAIFETASSNPTYYSPATQVDYSAYTAQVTAGVGGYSIYGGTFTTTFPVVSSEQYANLNLSLAQDHQGSFSDPVSSPVISVDLTNSAPQSGWYHNSVGNFLITFQAFTVYSKAPTYVYVPADNSSLSAAPVGLQRYVGEQNFVLIAVNDTSGSWSLGGFWYPYANGSVSPGTYTLGLTPGMNNFLLPRSVFSNSPLGQALLNGTNVSIAPSRWNGFLQGQWVPNDWYARATGGTWNGVTYTPGSQGYAKVFSSSNQNCTSGSTLCGGVPSDPQLEQSQPALSVEAVIGINVSTQANWESLLAGLLLNSSGNFTGWLFSAAPYLESLGLSSSVTGSMANPAFENDGGYGAPVSQQHKPNSWNTFAASAIWNVVSGIVGVLSTCWTAAFAGFVYVADLAAEAGNLALGLLSTIPALKAAERAILWAFEQLGTLILGEVKTLLSSALQPFFHLDNSYCGTLNQSANALYADTGSLGAPTTSHIVNFWNALQGPIFWIGIALGIAVEVAIYVTTPLDLGPAFLVGIILQLIVLGALLSVGNFAKGLDDLSYSGVRSIEAIVNASLADPTVKDQVKWSAFASAIGFASTDVSLALTYTMWRDAADDENLLWPTLVILFDTIALSLELSNLFFIHAPLMNVLALIFGGLGLIFAVVHLSLAKYPPTQLLALIASGLSAAAEGAAYYSSTTE